MQGSVVMLPLSPQQTLSPERRGAGSIFLGGGDIELLLLMLGVVKDVVYGHWGPGAPLVPRPHDVGYQHLPAHDKIVTGTSRVVTRPEPSLARVELTLVLIWNERDNTVFTGPRSINLVKDPLSSWLGSRKWYWTKNTWTWQCVNNCVKCSIHPRL